MIAMRSVFAAAAPCGCRAHGVAAAPTVIAEVVRKSRRFIGVLYITQPAPNTLLKVFAQTCNARAGWISPRRRHSPKIQGLLVSDLGSDVAVSVIRKARGS